MKQFLRDNPTLVFGLGLPILLVAVFALAAKFSSLDTVPPHYSVLYTVGNYNNPTGIQIHVVNQKATVDYVGTGYYGNGTRLFLYNPMEKTLHEIRLPHPPGLTAQMHKGDVDNHTITHLDIPELANLKLDGSFESPDGYSLTTDNYSSGGGLLTELFIGGRYRSALVLKKGNYAVNIPDNQNYYNNPQTVGWVIPQ